MLSVTWQDLLGPTGRASASALAALAEDAQGLGLGREAVGLWRHVLHSVPEALQPLALLRLALQEAAMVTSAPGGDAATTLAERSRGLRRFSRPAMPETPEQHELYWRLAPLLTDWLDCCPPHHLAHLHDMYSFVANTTSTPAPPPPASAGGGLRLAIVSESDVDCMLVEELLRRGVAVSVLLDGPGPSECEVWDDDLLPLFTTAALLPVGHNGSTGVDEAAAMVVGQRPDVLLFAGYRRPLLHHLAMRRLAPIQVRAVSHDEASLRRNGWPCVRVSLTRLWPAGASARAPGGPRGVRPSPPVPAQPATPRHRHAAVHQPGAARPRLAAAAGGGRVNHVCRGYRRKHPL